MRLTPARSPGRQRRNRCRSVQPLRLPRLPGRRRRPAGADRRGRRPRARTDPGQRTSRRLRPRGHRDDCAHPRARRPRRRRGAAARADGRRSAGPWTRRNLAQTGRRGGDLAPARQGRRHLSLRLPAGSLPVSDLNCGRRLPFQLERRASPPSPRPVTPACTSPTCSKVTTAWACSAATWSSRAARSCCCPRPTARSRTWLRRCAAWVRLISKRSIRVMPEYRCDAAAGTWTPRCASSRAKRFRRTSMPDVTGGGWRLTPTMSGTLQQDRRT